MLNSTIAEWRKSLIPGKPIVVRDNRTFHWCPHHKEPERGFPDGLHASSHTPEEHDAWSKYKKNFTSSKHNTPAQDKENIPKEPQKKMVMADEIRKVLLTTQPNLNAAQVEDFIQSVLKEWADCLWKAIAVSPSYHVYACSGYMSSHLHILQTSYL